MATGIGPLGWTLVSKTSQLVWAWIALNVAREANDDVAPTDRRVARPGEGGLGHDEETPEKRKENTNTRRHRIEARRPDDPEERPRT